MLFPQIRPFDPCIIIRPPISWELLGRLLGNAAALEGDRLGWWLERRQSGPSSPNVDGPPYPPIRGRDRAKAAADWFPSSQSLPQDSQSPTSSPRNGLIWRRPKYFKAFLLILGPFRVGFEVSLTPEMAFLNAFSLIWVLDSNSSL